MAISYINDDTIVAIATPAQAVGAIGIIRISGKTAKNAAGIVSRDIGESETKSHYFYRTKITGKKNIIIDDAMFVYMKGPNSYTGEDVVELHLHGNPLILEEVVRVLIESGLTRQALPGEFSFRAFQNGKIDLSQAEAVCDLISGKTDNAIHLAVNALTGKTASAIAELKGDLLKEVATVELEIDFSDQGTPVINYKELSHRLGTWIDKVNRALLNYEKSAPLRNGIRTAIVGEPNSGKSTLFNAFLGEDRSIVSHEAGTTRDVVREQFRMGGLLFVLSDTAGLRLTENSIEQEGIRRSYGEIQNAHLILVVLDGTQPINIPALENQRAKVLFLVNKVDVMSEADRERVIKTLQSQDIRPVFISAKNGLGLDELEQRIRSCFENAQIDGGSIEIQRSRHFVLLEKAKDSVLKAQARIIAGDIFPDLLAVDLRDALMHLGEISGEVSADDILNYIFSEFCIGK